MSTITITDPGLEKSLDVPCICGHTRRAHADGKAKGLGRCLVRGCPCRGFKADPKACHHPQPRGYSGPNRGLISVWCPDCGKEWQEPWPA